MPRRLGPIVSQYELRVSYVKTVTCRVDALQGGEEQLFADRVESLPEAAFKCVDGHIRNDKTLLPPAREL